MNKMITLETERLILRPFAAEDAHMAACNSQRPRVAAEMPDMILADEKAGFVCNSKGREYSFTKSY